MAAALTHRGPDDAGFVFVSAQGKSVECGSDPVSAAGGIRPVVAMGFRRLSIIDLSPLGHQPMCNEDRTLWLVFNGEIYNYIELMSALRARGHCFRSHSDSEVILHAYEEWGPDCVNRFNGMWAFALWDCARNRLFCSRDRFGVKPLVYSWDGKTLCLASEPKAIVHSGLVTAKPNYPYLVRFLTESILQDGRDTFYDGIQSLEPAHSFMVENGKLTRWRYWDYSDPGIPARYDFSNPGTTFRELFLDSVRIRLRSDVPLGACLSGGLDSSSIVAAVRHLDRAGGLATFSAVFDSKRNDESRYMQLMTQACATNHNTVPVQARELPEVMPKIVWHLDGPCLSASTYPFWKVSQLARRRVKVLLDGQGADELLGGYLGFIPACIVSSYRSALRKRSLKRLLQTGTGLFHAARFAGWRQLYFLYRDYSLLGRTLKPHRWYLGTEKVVHPELRSLVAQARGEIRRRGPRKFDDELTQVLYEHHSSSSLPGLLQYGDGVSMAHSLEARVPFLDYRLVEFCFALPPEKKIRGTTTKWLLRQSLRGLVPDAVLDRRDKIGFATPFAEWVRGELRDFMLDLLEGKTIREHGVFDPGELRKAIHRHLENRLDMSFYIWRWMATELWLQQLDDPRRGTSNIPAQFASLGCREATACALPS